MRKPSLNAVDMSRYGEMRKHRGLNGEKMEAQVRKQYFLATLFSVTCIAFLCLFGVQSFFNGNIFLGVTCMVGAVLNLVNLIFLRITKKYQVACLVIVLLMTLLTIYLVCSGGSNNTGPLWFYVMPILTFYVLELRYGLLTLVVLELLLIYILLVPENPILFADYDPYFISRFLGSLFAVSILAFAYEYSRQDWQKEIVGLSDALDKISRTDELTGLTNRRDMTERLEEEVARFKQNKRPFSIIVGDIDYFKQINDKYGHHCGDMVLKEIAHVMDSLTKEQDRVSRWGGEEFLVLLPDTNIEKGHVVAERLRQLVANLRILYDQQTIHTTMSFGVAEFNGSQDLTESMKTADNNLYYSKKNGRNCVA